VVSILNEKRDRNFSIAYPMLNATLIELGLGLTKFNKTDM
jgi:hypothetical protein